MKNQNKKIKLLQLRMKYGWEGIGIYHGILELLSESPTRSLPFDRKLLAFMLSAREETIVAIIKDFDLFEISNHTFLTIELAARRRKKAGIEEPSSSEINENVEENTTDNNAEKEALPQPGSSSRKSPRGKKPTYRVPIGKLKHIVGHRNQPFHDHIHRRR